ncbi:MAG TPA: SCO family protein [Rhizomicrobium sp.]|nr:SCO family protein [Rhizomicrobium sp.]
MRAWFVACLAALSVSVVSARLDAAPEWQFQLSTVSGREVTMADYRGKWLLIYFGYTFCPDICPTTLSELGGALKALGPRASNVHVLFITLDPTRDKIPVLARYLKAFDPRIVGLRGDPEETEDAAKSFHVYYRLRSVGHGEYAVDHSSYVYVFDPQGHFVKLLAPDAPGHKIAEDLKKIIR